MKIAAANALAMLAREEVPDSVADAYGGQTLSFGKNYIIPTPFDPRLIVSVSSAVAEAAIANGVARKPIEDLDEYRRLLSARLDPIEGAMQNIFKRISDNKKFVVFAEGEEERVIRAALAFKSAGYGYPILLGREHKVKETILRLSLDGANELPITNSSTSNHINEYTDLLYSKLQRRGSLYRDCQRMVNLDRNILLPVWSIADVPTLW